MRVPVARPAARNQMVMHVEDLLLQADLRQSLFNKDKLIQ
jgi:hypothetical protein